MRRLFNRLRPRAVVVIASSCFCAIMVGIVLNATIFQKGHHPAPLFGSAAARPAPIAAREPPVPPDLAATLAPAQPDAQPVPAPASAPVVAAPPRAAHAQSGVRAAAAAQRPADPIGALIRDEGLAAAQPTGSSSKTRGDRPKSAAQTPALGGHARLRPAVLGTAVN